MKRQLFVRSVFCTKFVFLYFIFKEVVRAEMTPQRKRRLTYITIGMFFLLGGVEYGKLFLLPQLSVSLLIFSQVSGNVRLAG